MLKLFNSYTRKKQVFRAISPKKVKIYSCGPTVYDYCHIGNLRSFLFADLLRRFLELDGFAVMHVMNITDVDDKTIKKSIEQKKSLEEITTFYKHEFLNDIESVRIRRPDIMPHATQHIKEMVSMIEALIANGYAYVEKDGCVYFDVSKFKRYGKLSKLKIRKLKENARMKNDNYEKEEVHDFALWKSWDKNDGDISWSTSLGRGRPGWHIECSAMSVKYLGEFDIHTGGTDLKFPHHENELAQSICAGFVGPKFWMHNEHLLVNGRKMSKSLGNYFTLRDIVNKGYEPIAFRYLCLSTHYRTQLNFTFDALVAASKTISNINSFMRKVNDAIKTAREKKLNEEISFAVSTYRRDFMKAMEDDLNTTLALKAIFAMMNIVNRNIDNGAVDAASLNEAVKLMKDANSIFDFFIIEEELNEEDTKLIAEREEARLKHDWERADHIRELLKKKGILLDDTPYGVVWKRKI